MYLADWIVLTIPPQLKPCRLHSSDVCWIAELAVSLSTSVLPWSNGVASWRAQQQQRRNVPAAAAVCDCEIVGRGSSPKISDLVFGSDSCQINSAHYERRVACGCW